MSSIENKKQHFLLLNILQIYIALTFFFVIGCTPDKTNKKEKKNPIPVETMKVSKEDIPIYLNDVGYVEAYSSVEVVSRVAGRVIEIRFDNGEYVSKGDLLLKIDPTDYEYSLKHAKASLMLAQARLDMAKLELGRIKKLFKEGHISKEKYDRSFTEYKVSRASLEQAKAGLMLARLNLERTIIKAPLAGWITNRHIDEGDEVSPYTPLCEILALNPAKVLIYVTQDELKDIDKGDPVEITSNLWPGMVLSAKIVNIDVSADPKSGTFKIEIEVPNKRLWLKQGMRVKVKIKKSTILGAIAIPQEALLFRGGESKVYIIKNKKAIPQKVQTGETIGNKIIIKKGLSPGDDLVIKGQSYLSPGQAVKVIVQ